MTLGSFAVSFWCGFRELSGKINLILMFLIDVLDDNTKRDLREVIKRKRKTGR